MIGGPVLSGGVWTTDNDGPVTVRWGDGEEVAEGVALLEEGTHEGLVASV